MAICEVPGCGEEWAGSLRGVVLCREHSIVALDWVRDVPRHELHHATVSSLVARQSLTEPE